MRRSVHGFTLVELMVVVAIISVLVVFSVPSYQRAIEQSRADIAGANLRAVWAAQRLYWVGYQSYAPDMDTLADLGLIDPAIVAGTGWYGYSITLTPTGFTATATRTSDGGASWTGAFEIKGSSTGQASDNESDGIITGALSNSGGGASIQPGFQ